MRAVAHVRVWRRGQDAHQQLRRTPADRGATGAPSFSQARAVAVSPRVGQRHGIAEPRLGEARVDRQRALIRRQRPIEGPRPTQRVRQLQARLQVAGVGPHGGREPLDGRRGLTAAEEQRAEAVVRFREVGILRQQLLIQRDGGAARRPRRRARWPASASAPAGPAPARGPAGMPRRRPPPARAPAPGRRGLRARPDCAGSRASSRINGSGSGGCASPRARRRASASSSRPT